MKEDIKNLTRSQEEIKHEFNKKLEFVKQHHSLCTVVASERMSANQRAYTNLKKLLDCRNDPSIIHVCRLWIDNNCIYLSQEIRSAFWHVIALAENLVERISEADKCNDHIYAKENHERFERFWRKVTEAMQIVQNEVNLPPLAESGLRELEK